MFGRKNVSVSTSGLVNMRNELVAKMNRTANMVEIYDDANARHIRLHAAVLSAAKPTELNLDVITVTAMVAGVEFRSEMDSFLRLSKM